VSTKKTVIFIFITLNYLYEYRGKLNERKQKCIVVWNGVAGQINHFMFSKSLEMQRFATFGYKSNDVLVRIPASHGFSMIGPIAAIVN